MPEEAAPMTVSRLCREIAATLAGTSDSAQLDARVIVAHVLRCRPNDLPLRDLDVVPPDRVATIRDLAHRRLAGEPVARITGEKEFYGLTFTLSPETLVPRPDTETLIDAVLARIDRAASPAILDLGTGSGAILLALLTELPNATGVGVDRSADALATAARNAELLGIARRAQFREGDWAAGIERRFDVVVSNPPYIATQEIAALPVEVRRHDPYFALDGGDDGLAAYRAIFADLPRILTPEGRAFFEIGFGQAPDVGRLAEAAGFQASFERDLAGIERVAVLVRSAAGAA
jgi:release factor glutamine methyltransferase